MAADKTAAPTAEDLEALKKDIAELRKGLTELGGDIKDSSSGAFNELREKIAELAHDKADAIKHGFESAKQRTEQGAACAKQFAQEHPLATVGGALGLGLLIGILLGRKQ